MKPDFALVPTMQCAKNLMGSDVWLFNGNSLPSNKACRPGRAAEPRW